LTQTRPTPFQNGILTNSCSIGSKKDIWKSIFNKQEDLMLVEHKV
jgi:hypothetical protein